MTARPMVAVDIRERMLEALDLCQALRKAIAVHAAGKPLRAIEVHIALRMLRNTGPVWSLADIEALELGVDSILPFGTNPTELVR